MLIGMATTMEPWRDNERGHRGITWPRSTLNAHKPEAPSPIAGAHGMSGLHRCTCIVTNSNQSITKLIEDVSQQPLPKGILRTEVADNNKAAHPRCTTYGRKEGEHGAERKCGTTLQQ